MKQLSKKETNRLYGKDKKRKSTRIPKTEPYKRQKISVKDFNKIEQH